MKSLVKTVVLITGFSVLTRIVGFLFRIYLSRAIGAEALGLYQVAFSVFMVLLTIISSGLPFIISRMTAGYRISNDKHKQGKLVSSALILGVLISLALCGVVLLLKSVFANIFADESCLLILIALLPALVFSAVYSVFRGAMWGQDNYFALCGVSALFVVLLYFIYGGKMSKPGKEYKQLIKRSAPITGVRVAGSLAQPLIAFIIPLRLMSVGYSSSQAMSLFGVAVGMTMPLLFIPTTLIGSLSTALVPDISMAVVKEDNAHIESRIRSSVVFSLFISAMVVPLFIGAGEMIGEFLFDNSLSGVILASSAWLMIPMGLTNITSSLLNSLGYEIKSCVNYFIGAIVMFVAIWFLPIICGINALFWGMGICMCITSVLNFFMLKRKTKVKLKILRPLVLLVITTIPSVAITSFVGVLCSFVMPQFLSIIISCAMGMAFYLLLCMIFNVVDVKGYFVQVSSKLKKKNKQKPLKI